MYSSYVCGLSVRLYERLLMRSKKTKVLVLCATLAALSVVLLSIGSFIEVLDLTAAMLASILTFVAVIEGGRVKAILTYAVTVILGFVLLPVKLPALIYALSGYYPVIKSIIERKSKRIVAIILKAVFFNASLALFLLSVRFFVPNFELMPELKLGRILTYAVTFLLGNATFALYDILLTRVISLYLFKIRHRLGLDKNR